MSFPFSMPPGLCKLFVGISDVSDDISGRALLRRRRHDMIDPEN